MGQAVYAMRHIPILPYPVIHYEEHIEALAVLHGARRRPLAKEAL